MIDPVVQRRPLGAISLSSLDTASSRPRSDGVVRAARIPTSHKTAVCWTELRLSLNPRGRARRLVSQPVK